VITDSLLSHIHLGRTHFIVEYGSREPAHWESRRSVPAALRAGHVLISTMLAMQIDLPLDSPGVMMWDLLDFFQAREGAYVDLIVSNVDRQGKLLTDTMPYDCVFITKSSIGIRGYSPPRGTPLGEVDLPSVYRQIGLLILSPWGRLQVVPYALIRSARDSVKSLEDYISETEAEMGQRMPRVQAAGILAEPNRDKAATSLSS
jgi:hypothetical protein